MLWRHLFEDHLDSPQFAQQQLPFEQHIYQQIIQCYRSETLGAVERIRCAQKVEARLQQYSLAVQWIITQREKVVLLSPRT